MALTPENPFLAHFASSEQPPIEPPMTSAIAEQSTDNISEALSDITADVITERTAERTSDITGDVTTDVITDALALNPALPSLSLVMKLIAASPYEHPCMFPSSRTLNRKIPMLRGPDNSVGCEVAPFYSSFFILIIPMYFLVPPFYCTFHLCVFPLFRCFSFSY